MDDSSLSVKNRKSVTQLFRYAFVGITTNAVGYIIYLLVTHLGATPKITMTFLYGISAVVGFLGNRKFTFMHKGSLIGAGGRYIITHCFGYFINLSILIIMVDKYGYAHQWVQAIAILVVAAFLFLAFKYFVFREKDISNTGGK